MESQSANVNPGDGSAGVADGGRFAPYVAELREFFASSGMRFGTPEDLAAFAEALKEPGTFREELASLTRSVVYREQGKIAITELLELMTVAMGGARVAEAGEVAREPMRELLGFLGKAMRGRAEAFDDVRRSCRRVDRWILIREKWLSPGWSMQRLRAPRMLAGFIRMLLRSFIRGRGRSRWRLRTGVRGRRLCRVEIPMLRRVWWDAAALALRPTASESARRSSRVEWGLFACAIAGVVMAAVMFVHPGTEPATGRVEEPTIFGVGPADGAAAGGTSDLDSGAGIPARSVSTVSGIGAGAAADATAVRPGASGSVGRAKPAAGEPMLPAAARGGAMRTSASMGSLPSKGMGVYTVSPGVMAAKLISAPEPAYPKLAGLIHMEGPVILQAVVSRDGKVVTTHVLRGHRLLRGAASDAVRRWRYRPYLVNGQPADVATTVTVNFRRR